MIKAIRYIFLLLLFVVASTGCKRAQLRAQLKELMGSTIVLPEKTTCVHNGEIYPMPDSLRNKPKLIVYIDSTECTTCRISHFWEYQEIFDLSAQTKAFEVMLLLCNTDFESIPLTRYLSDRELINPVYVDTDNAFLKDNPAIPPDARMHSLLVDSTGTPMFVGDPIRSEQMMAAFKIALRGKPK
jgi:hypothetical protein